jgi:hypothetical protein
MWLDTKDEDQGRGIDWARHAISLEPCDRYHPLSSDFTVRQVRALLLEFPHAGNPDGAEAVQILAFQDLRPIVVVARSARWVANTAPAAVWETEADETVRHLLDVVRGTPISDVIVVPSLGYFFDPRYNAKPVRGVRHYELVAVTALIDPDITLNEPQYREQYDRASKVRRPKRGKWL